MRVLTVTTIILIIQVQVHESLTPDEICELCQHTQKTVYGHFGGRVPSKRVLHKQLKHECRRLPKYKRRCLMIVEPNIGIIFAEMTNNSFKSSKLCEQLKECSKNQSPFVTTLVVDDGTFNRTFQETEMDRRVLSIDLITPLPQI